MDVALKEKKNHLLAFQRVFLFYSIKSHTLLLYKEVAT